MRAWPLRPSPMIEFYNVKNLRIEDVCIENALRVDDAADPLRQCVHPGDQDHEPDLWVEHGRDRCDDRSHECVHFRIGQIDTGDDAICLKFGGSVRWQERAGAGVEEHYRDEVCPTTCCNGFKFGTATRGDGKYYGSLIR